MAKVEYSGGKSEEFKKDSSLKSSLKDSGYRNSPLESRDFPREHR